MVLVIGPLPVVEPDPEGRGGGGGRRRRRRARRTGGDGAGGRAAAADAAQRGHGDRQHASLDDAHLVQARTPLRCRRRGLQPLARSTCFRRSEVRSKLII